MRNYLLLFLLLISVAISSCKKQKAKCCGEPDYREAMREFVCAISQYSKFLHPGFIIIPQNGESLFTGNGEHSGNPESDYLNFIDATGKEELFYGFDNRDNEQTPQDEHDWMLGFLEIAKANNVVVMTTDYCSDQTKMDDSYQQNLDQGFISFAADHRDLDNIPLYPNQPFNENADDIDSISEAKNFLYLISTGAYSSKQSMIDAIAQTNYDMMVIDFFFENEELTVADVDALCTKANGGKRLVICYMSIGEAEDYRWYWNDKWKVGNPCWLQPENPDWKGNYRVCYWMSEWQNIIYGSPDSYLDKILAAGFDGVYLDIVDGFEYFEDL